MTSQLFKSFGKDKVSGHSQLKASVQRGIRGAPPQPPAACRHAVAPHSLKLRHCCVPSSAAKIIEDYPWLVETGVIDVILPKKQDLILVKL